MKVAIIQARMASTRLPGKALAQIGDRPLIHHTLRRASRIRGVDRVVLATSRALENDALAETAAALGAVVHRGDEDDVLGRFHAVATALGADTVIRLTGDNPLVDPAALSFLLARHTADANDYTCLTGLPTGAAGDIFSFKALDISHHQADGAALADHVDLFVLENLARFRVVRYALAEGLSDWRWTVDDAADLARLRRFADTVGAARFAELTTGPALAAATTAGLEAEMRPTVVNISPENRYTATLVAGIADCRTVTLDTLARAR